MEGRPTAAFVLSLLAGLAMLATGSMMYRMGTAFMGWDSWMWGYGMMRTMAPGMWSPWFGAAGGVLVIIGSIILYTTPGQSRTWGLVILILSALNFLVGMGGVLAGGLGIAGGAFAMTWPGEQRNT